MIKKEYIQPVAKEIRIKPATILANSLERSNETVGSSQVQSFDVAWEEDYDASYDAGF